ncbi:Fic family protein [Terrihalobacillus insolitus]|uniref:Fic family protein n=1 Tax=Terrihalobacillus insolitus TaxID=2950438 RepID=UPI0023415B65|nr:Fic family protein [Terrihalobacillus insolitus]MDC3414493.1 Fic family protein [Terrihalobacillus insolitus]
MYQVITKLKKELDDRRPLSKNVIQNLRETIRILWTYHSNAIEGNTLSLVETKIVLEEGITIGGTTLREHFEAINHAEAIDYVEDLVKKEINLTENVLKDIHRLILRNIDVSNAGKYRNNDVYIKGSQHIPPQPYLIGPQMEDLFLWYSKNKGTMHPVELAARFHFKFVYIHPFIDGNGRTARLLMNLILMQNGYPPAIIKVDLEQRVKYYKALEKASVDNNVEEFIQFVIDNVEESLRMYLRVARPK